MKIVLASNNKGKIEEFIQLMPQYEIVAFNKLLGDIDIVEDAETFKGNAIIKAQTVYEKLNDENVIVISDDSGITVSCLNNEPGVYSARYAGENATSEDNVNKLIKKLDKRALKEADAFYTACIAIVFKGDVYTVHGWMHGRVINEARGDKGFGYDPMFIPNGFDKTLGELDSSIKKEISHRSKALNLAKKIISIL